MTTTTYTDATTAQTKAEILADGLQHASDNGVNVAGFDDASPQRAMFELNARAIEAEQKIRVKLAQAGFLTTAALAGESFFDEALTWYDLDNGFGGKGRIPATQTIWAFKVTLTAGNPSITIGANTSELVAQANDGTLFTSFNVVPVTIGPGGTRLVQFNCNVLGTVGNQSAGNVVHLVVGHPGLSVSNAPGAFVILAARDKETTDDATLRAVAKWSTLGAGWTRASFDYLIPTLVPTITRWLTRDDNPNGPGTIEVVLANAAGASTSLENAAALAGLGAPGVMTLGTGGLYVVSATENTVTVTGAIAGDGTNPSLLANAKSALDIVRGKFPIGGDSDGLLRLDLLTAILMGGAWPASAPLKISGPSGTVASIVLPGFGGAKSVTLSAPATDPTFSLTDVMLFDYTGLVVA